MKMFFAALTALALSGSIAKADLLGYWDFNADNLLRSAGDMGDLTVQTEGFLDIGFDEFGLGTDVNLLPDFEEGDSQGFYSLAEIAETVRFTISDLNLTGYTSPEISFAARNDAAFAAGDEFYLEYNVGGGWVRATTFADPDDDFTRFSFTFSSGILDHAANVALRFSHHTGVGVIDEFEVDNIQINATAVPEPGTVALLGLAGFMVGGAVLRRRSPRN